MKVGPHVMTHSHNQHHDREVVPRVGAGNAQAGGNFKLIQCQLMLLLHARRCQQRHELMLARNNNANQQSATNSMARALLLNCPIRHCRAMKEVLNHMKTCRLGGGCTYQHCTTSLRILSHWTNCTVEDCPLCQCVRQRMRRAKEWEQTLPRSSRYTLLAAALRSSQAPRPVAPNCNAAEQAQEAQSGFPCQNQEELRSWPNADNHSSPQPQQPQAGLIVQKRATEPNENPVGDKIIDGTPSVPSLDQVRKAYEQLGIPCPEEALKRLMATLPNSSQEKPQRRIECDREGNNMETNSMDQGVFDCSGQPPTPPMGYGVQNQPGSSTHFRFQLQLQQQQQHSLISSTTTSTHKLPNKSSTNARPK